MTVKDRAQRDEPSGRSADTQQPVGTICCRVGLCSGAVPWLCHGLGLGWSLPILLRSLPHSPSTPLPKRPAPGCAPCLQAQASPAPAR